MERALDPNLLALALGDAPQLPTVQELSTAIATIEVELTLGRPEFDDGLLSTAWYLHSVAASPDSLERYGFERKRAAYSVAGHVFDLRLATEDLPEERRREFCFAAQTSFLGSQLSPNTLAVYRRSFASGATVPRIDEDPGASSLGIAVGLLGGDYGHTFTHTSRIQAETDELLSRWGLESLDGTGLGQAHAVAIASRHLAVFLSYGRVDRLEMAEEILRRGLSLTRRSDSLVSEWVAAHLLDFADHVRSSSVWTGLPPSVLPGVRHAFSAGHPKAPILWPPQLDLLGENEGGEGFNCLSDEVRRAFISTPTSGGKTLLSQLIISDFLSRNASAACYVAPTRALCNEVSRALSNRLRYVGTGVQYDLPFWEGTGEYHPDGPRLEVMTPERLSHLIRNDAEGVLERFGLFVFDEIHMVGEGSRGWTLESTLSFLHNRTAETGHRIICMSAAVGNRFHFSSWMATDGIPARTYHRDWRGPRRLHCVWSTVPDRDHPEDLPTRSKKYPTRRAFPLLGQLGIRPGDQGVKWFRTSEPVGRLVLQYPSVGAPTRHKDSTPDYRALVTFVAHLCESGPTLVIEAVRRQALRTAKAVAETLNVDVGPGIQPLRDLIRARLSADHPLSEIVAKGVAYHHGCLPLEIRAAIQEAVGSGHIRCLVATPTMTEGVNLPVRSVVIANTGSYQKGGKYKDYIVGPKLLNALGRAGRAGIETEGVLAIALHSRADSEAFDRLAPTDEELKVGSLLGSEQALEELGRFEEALLAAQDKAVELAAGSVGSFMSFIWFVASELDRLGTSPKMDGIEEVLARSLAWVQLDENTLRRWIAVAEVSLDAFDSTSPELRRRWAQSGVRIRSSKLLEELAEELRNECENAGAVTDPVSAIRLILSDSRLERLASLEEHPGRKVFSSPAGSRDELPVNLREICLDWVDGKELEELASEYLDAVGDVDFRFEQLTDFINDYFEIFLPWVIGTLIEWVNQRIGFENPLLPPSLPSLIRYGVGDEVAVEIMQGGVQSRILALGLSEQWRASDSSDSPRDWVGELDQSQWRTLFNASDADIRALLDYARPYGGTVIRDVLRGQDTWLSVASLTEDCAEVSVQLHLEASNDTADIWIQENGKRLGKILPRDQLDIRDLIKTQLPLDAGFSASKWTGLLKLNLAPEE